MISSSVETGSGMLYKDHSAYMCLRLTAHYEPEKVTVEAKDATCALPFTGSGSGRHEVHHGRPRGHGQLKTA